jgi:hypothetical protein
MAKVNRKPSREDAHYERISRHREAHMSPDRTNAYRRVLQTLDELGPSKLQVAEQDRIRYAADNLIFCQDFSEDASARDALADIRLLFEHLVDSHRWEQVTADKLGDDVRACGPVPELEKLAA